MRLIPQILRHYVVMNAYRASTISGMLDNCGNMPTLLNLKRRMLHNKKLALKCVDWTIGELSDGTFHFKWLSRKEQGDEYDPARVFEEDIADTVYTNWELIGVCRELKAWIEKQPAYKYPAELNS